MRPAHRLPAIVVLVAVLAAAGCSLRSDDAPRPIAKDAIPPVLFQQNPSSTTTQPSDTGTPRRYVYLVSAQDTDEVLERASVAITAPANPDELPRIIIERLVNNPPVTAELTSAIPPGTKVLGVVKRGDLLEIDLSNLGAIEGPRQRLAVAQIVYTATAIAGISGVRFLIDGNLSAVPLEGRTSEPGETIRRADFPKLDPTATTTTTVTEPPVSDVPEGEAPPEPTPPA